MKSVLGLAALTLSLVLVSFRNSVGIDDIAVAMRSGNIGQISRYLDSRVGHFPFPRKSDTYSKSQAEMIIRDFFATNVVKNFLVQHKGENGGSEFCVGVLQTHNGDYRTTLFMKQKGDKKLLQELRFQPAQ